MARIANPRKNLDAKMLLARTHRRVLNLDEHVKHLLNAVKELRRDRDADRAEMKRLRDRIERMDAE